MKIMWHAGPPVDLSKQPPVATFEGYPAIPGETSAQYIKRLEATLLPEPKRVVTHACMTRTQMNILLVLGLVIGLAGLYLWMQAEDRAAVESMDYSRCQSASCSAEISHRLTGN